MSTVTVTSTGAAEQSYEGQLEPRIEMQVDHLRPISGPSASDRSLDSVRGSIPGKIRNLMCKRRLKGFVSDTSGEVWRVVFIEEGKEVPYELPSKPLLEVGIKARYQPFEMDELVPTSPGATGKVYQFRALAHVEDSLIEPVDLDQERRSKLDKIFAHFGKKAPA